MCMLHVCGCLQRPEKATGFPGVGVIGDSELPSINVGNLTLLLKE